MNNTELDDALVDLARELLPSADPDDLELFDHGQFHQVVLAPRIGAIRVARQAGQPDQLRRVGTLCERLATAGLPFAVPTPLGPVVEHEGRAALATAWVPGQPAPKGSPRVNGARLLLESLADVDVAIVADVLAPPHAYAGGDRWHNLLVDEVVPCLPAHVREEATRRIAAADALEPPVRGLVHGDLAGDNVRWDGQDVVGVVDWDLAAAWDPAVDVACLAWHGWDTVRGITDRETYRRAVTWYRVFGLEQIAADLLSDGPADRLDQTIDRTTEWLETTPHPPDW